MTALSDKGRIKPTASRRAAAASATPSSDAAASFRPLHETQGWSLAILLVLAIVTPNQFTVVLGGVSFHPIRIALILLLIPGILKFLSRTGMRLENYDLTYFAFSLWTGVAILVNRGAGGIERAGQFVLETMFLYVIVQGAIRSVANVRAVVDLLFKIVLVLGLFGIPELLSGEYYLLNLLNKMIGSPPQTELLAAPRFGLTRVTSIFAHPILFGIFCAATASLVWYFSRDNATRLWRSAVVFAVTMMSLSSGPFVVLLVQYACIFCERITRGMRHRLKKFLAAFGFFYVFINIVSNRGLFLFIVLISFEPATAYYRRLIWENGIDDVQRNPIFGIRPEEWTRIYWMGSSIDNYWLFQAMQGGLPSVVFLMATLVLIGRRMFRLPTSALPAALEALRRGWIYMIFGFAICGATVHFFDKIQPYFALMVALGGAIARLIADWERHAAARAAEQAAAAPGTETETETVTAAAPRRRTWL